QPLRSDRRPRPRPLRIFPERSCSEHGPRSRDDRVREALRKAEVAGKMSDLPLSVCFWDYDRTRPLYDGRIQIPGAVPKYSILNPVAAFAKAFSTAEFDVTELSLAGHIAAVAKGNAAYEGIPVHLSRTLRHSTISVPADRPVTTPADLKGKLIGIPDYDMTAALILRGLFRDEYGIAPSDMA